MYNVLHTVTTQYTMSSGYEIQVNYIGELRITCAFSKQKFFLVRKVLEVPIICIVHNN